MANINGNNRPNTLTGTAERDLIQGFGGDDTLNGLGGNDELRGGNGNDTANGGNGIDLLAGLNGNDRLNGQAGNDRLDGGLGDDRLDGGLGDDSLLGANGVDILFGRAGNDILTGGNSDSGTSDLVSDRLFGGDGNDHIEGSDASSDRLFGENGNDSFIVLNDVASGGLGNDGFSIDAGGRVTGGAGADRFSFFTNTGGTSENLEVTDFTAADTFGWSVSDADFNLLYGAQQVFDFFDSNNDDVISANDRFVTSPEGVFFNVVDTGPDLLLFVGGDSVTFDNVGIINGADWA